MEGKRKGEERRVRRRQGREGKKRGEERRGVLWCPQNSLK